MPLELHSWGDPYSKISNISLYPDVRAWRPDIRWPVALGLPLRIITTVFIVKISTPTFIPNLNTSCMAVVLPTTQQPGDQHPFEHLAQQMRQGDRMVRAGIFPVLVSDFQENVKRRPSFHRRGKQPSWRRLLNSIDIWHLALQHTPAQLRQLMLFIPSSKSSLIFLMTRFVGKQGWGRVLSCIRLIYAKLTLKPTWLPWWTSLCRWKILLMITLT